MKRVLFVLLAGGLAVAPATAQTPSRPTLVLTIFGGLSAGNDLWAVGRQGFCVLEGTGVVQNCSPAYDTLRLTRAVSPSLVAGATATYYPGPLVGYTLEVAYLGAQLDDKCAVLFLNTDPQGSPTLGTRNEQVCNDISHSSFSPSPIAFLGGVTLRAAAGRTVSPYVRGAVGIVAYASGTIGMSGVYVDAGGVQERAVYVEDKPTRAAFAGQLAGGFAMRLGPGYQFHFEVRDIVAPMKRVTGPSNDLLRPPTETRVYHHVALTVGLGIILEKSRGRRY